jgi:hypothetical protein
MSPSSPTDTGSGRARAGSVRAASVLVALALFVVALSGCVRAEVDARIDRDGRVSGVVIIAFSTALLQAVGQSRTDVIADVRGATKELPKGLSIDVYDVDGYVGERITFSGVPYEKFGAMVATAAQGSGALGAKTAQDFVLDRTSKHWRFFGTIDLTEAAIAAIPGVNGADVAALQKATKVNIKITFPGAVTARDKDAKVRGKAISWAPLPGQRIQMQAVAKLK